MASLQIVSVRWKYLLDRKGGDTELQPLRWQSQLLPAQCRPMPSFHLYRHHDTPSQSIQDPSASVTARTNCGIILMISVCGSMGMHQLSIRKVANIIYSVVFVVFPEAMAHIGAAATAAACAALPVVQRMNQLVGMGGKTCIWQPCLHKVGAIFKIRQFNAASWCLRGLVLPSDRQIQNSSLPS